MHCSRCSTDAAIELRYEGTSLCSGCFTKLIETRLARHSRQHGLVRNGDSIAVAYSGGKDSGMVLNWLASRRSKVRDLSLTAFTVTRGDPYSKDSLKVARSVCESLSIPHQEFRFRDFYSIDFTDINRLKTTMGLNACAICGVMRRKIWDAAAKELGASKLATGHNLTDEATSYLMNFASGDMRAMSALGPVSPATEGLVPKIKPIRCVPEAEVRAYMDAKGFAYWAPVCPCRHGSLRESYEDVLESMLTKKPGAEFTIVQTGDALGNILRSSKPVSLHNCPRCGQPCSGRVCRTCQYLAEFAKL